MLQRAITSRSLGGPGGLSLYSTCVHHEFRVHRALLPKESIAGKSRTRRIPPSSDSDRSILPQHRPDRRGRVALCLCVRLGVCVVLSGSGIVASSSAASDSSGLFPRRSPGWARRDSSGLGRRLQRRPSGRAGLRRGQGKVAVDSPPWGRTRIASRSTFGRFVEPAGPGRGLPRGYSETRAVPRRIRSFRFGVAFSLSASRVSVVGPRGFG